MKTLYFELKMGGAGDMFSGALYDLLSIEKRLEFLDTMNNIGLEGVEVGAVTVSNYGISGTKIHVVINGMEEGPGGLISDHVGHHTHDHHHSTPARIMEIISGLNVPQKVKEDAMGIYDILAKAECKAHGESMDTIHFHEVGMLDAIADVTGFCLLVHMISPDRIISSPVHMGGGHIRCAHGLMPVPAPAVANIVQGIPVYTSDVNGELLTPTGAAIIKYYSESFGPMPAAISLGTGYGMGTRDFGKLSCVRAMLLESMETADNPTVVELSCNVDDMTGEEAGFALSAIMDAGARDAFFEHIIMKKSRPGLKFTVISTMDKKDALIEAIFKHTTTIGIREYPITRHVLTRKIHPEETDYGIINKKISTGYGITREKWEYEELARIAKKEGLSLFQIKNIIETSASKS